MSALIVGQCFRKPLTRTTCPDITAVHLHSVGSAPTISIPLYPPRPLSLEGKGKTLQYISHSCYSMPSICTAVRLPFVPRSSVPQNGVGKRGHVNHILSGKKKEPKPKLFGPDISRWGGGLPREGVGAKKFGMSFETQGNQTFGRDIPGFCWDIPGCPKSLRKRGLCSILVPYLFRSLFGNLPLVLGHLLVAILVIFLPIPFCSTVRPCF